MKTFLVQIEKFDNAVSVREKIRWAKANRILLIWPRRGKVVFNEVDLDLFKREAAHSGADLAFVCHDPKVEETADVYGISVFPSVPKAEGSKWKKTRHEFKAEPEPVLNEQKRLARWETKKVVQRDHRFVRYCAILLTSLAILAMLVFLIPSATVTIFPQLTEKTIKIDVWASPEFTSVNINGNLPAKEQSVQLSKTESAQSSGKTELPSKYASGTVIFNNISGQDVTIPSGTLLSKGEDEEIKFVTTEAVSVGAGMESSPIKVLALNAGSQGNAEPGMVTQIDGQLGGLLTVTNAEAITGGNDSMAPSPTEEDYQKLERKILDELRKQAAGQLQTTGEKLIENTLDDGTVTSEIRSADVGTAADNFSLTVNVEFSGLTFLNNDLDSLVDHAMNAGLTDGSAIYGKGVTITDAGNPQGSLKDGAKWSLTAKAEVGEKPDQTVLIEAISGKRIEDAKRIISNIIPVRGETRIETTPFFWKWLPWLSLNTKIEVQ